MLGVLFANIKNALPIGSMYSIHTYIWLIFMVNVGKYTIHGLYAISINIKKTRKMKHYPNQFLHGKNSSIDIFVL